MNGTAVLWLIIGSVFTWAFIDCAIPTVRMWRHKRKMRKLVPKPYQPKRGKRRQK